jgi:hypothetical protein
LCVEIRGIGEEREKVEVVKVVKIDGEILIKSFKLEIQDDIFDIITYYLLFTISSTLFSDTPLPSPSSPQPHSIHKMES